MFYQLPFLLNDTLKFINKGRSLQIIIMKSTILYSVIASVIISIAIIVHRTTAYKYTNCCTYLPTCHKALLDALNSKLTNLNMFLYDNTGGVLHTRVSKCT